jgi:hypothetical protein
MTETNNTNNLPPRETQQQRWIKYGGNVVLTSVVVIILAGVLIAISQRSTKRFDTTVNKEYSLKPQTINIIKDLKAPVKLVSLYTRPDGSTDRDITQRERADTVADLLGEYKSSGRNIEVETIDPTHNPTKVDDLIADVTSKYGGEVKKYRDFCESASKYFEPVKQFALGEKPKVEALPVAKSMNASDVDETISQIDTWLSNVPGDLDDIAKAIEEQRKQKIPNYKGAADNINATMQNESDNADRIAQVFAKFQADPNVKPEFKAYMKDAAPRYAELKKQADAVVAEYKKLGELKLDDLRQKLRERDAILVMGPNDMRSLSFDQVWQPETDKRAYQNTSGDVKIKPKFAGEQQLTGAILSLTSATKPKVVFLRPGGGPLTSPGFPPFQQGGPFSKVADRLRDYNFDVLEKDLSGQYAMQAQMRGEPPAPEPSDDEIKDAVWIILGFPNENPQMPTAPMGQKLAEHLAAGGSALCLFTPSADNLSDALKDWGIDVRTDLMAVHQPIKTEVASSDIVDEARKTSYIFVTNNYGDHLITRPLKSLDGILLPALPVITTPKAGYQTTPILPVPEVTKIWATHDGQSALAGDPIQFKPDSGDLGPPLFVGAASQSDKGARVVAIGSLEFIHNNIVGFPDMEMRQRGIPAARFPGNAELFCNSVFWLSHMEPLIAISPSAMEVNRIGDISDGALKAWRVGLLLIGLPGAVIICGLLVYFARRD